jgi:ABC transporter, substrate-binding protein, aliphatic sulfonates family
LTFSPKITNEAAALSVFALLTFLAGCGPRGEAQKATAGGADGATAPPAAVRVAFFPNVTHAAALYASGTGAFEEALGDSIRVEERVFTAGPSEIEALFAGEVDIGYIGPGPALNGYLKSRGKALRIVAGASSGGAALVARQDIPLKGVADLGGKRVAVPQTGGTQDISLRHALAEAGLKPREKGGTVDVVQYAPADTLNLFKEKQIDAAWLPEPWVARLEAEAGARVVVDERDLWPGGKFATTVVIARSEFLEKHPDLVEKFLGAHIAAVDAIGARPEEARRVIGERLAALNQGKKLPEAILKTALSRTDITHDALNESVLTFADWSAALGYQREDRTALAGLFTDTPRERALAARGAAPPGKAVTAAAAAGAAAAREKEGKP